MDEMEKRALADVLSMQDSFVKLNESMDNELPELAEEIFLEFWLPYLATPTGDTHVNAWVNQVAISAHRAVKIMKDGEVVCIVPPVMTTKKLTKTRYAYSKGLFEVVNKAIDRGNVNPRRGNAIFYDMVSGAISAPEIDMDAAKQWDAILVKYGYPSMFADLPVEKTANSVKSGGPTMMEASFDEFDEV